jgi:tRNA-dihydrouridine synthase 1
MKKCDLPVTAKIRILSNVEKTLEYAKSLEEVGISLLTVHGRERHQKGTLTGLADWKVIKAVVDALNIPVVANGNILYYKDIKRSRESTGAVGVMVAKTNLYNPALFNPSVNWKGVLGDPSFFSTDRPYSYKLHQILLDNDYPLLVEHPPSHYLAFEYLSICKSLCGNEFPDGLRPGVIRGHCFKLLRNLMRIYDYTRPILGTAKSIDDFYKYLVDFSEVIAEGIITGNVAGLNIEIPPTNWDLLLNEKIESTTENGVYVEGGWRKLPYWVAQPYIRSYKDEDNGRC